MPSRPGLSSTCQPHAQPGPSCSAKETSNQIRSSISSQQIPALHISPLATGNMHCSCMIPAKWPEHQATRRPPSTHTSSQSPHKNKKPGAHAAPQHAGAHAKCVACKGGRGPHLPRCLPVVNKLSALAPDLDKHSALHSTAEETHPRARNETSCSRSA